MRPLAGLPDYYNRAAVILRKALPQPLLSDDPLMLTLSALDPVDKGFLAEASDPLRLFVRTSENLLESDYGPIASLAGTSMKDLWLPILLLGRGWSGHVESLLGIPATSWNDLGLVRAIIFTPVTNREKPKLIVRLHNPIIGIRREFYKDFENSIKTPFRLRATFNRLEERIDLLDEASRIINGPVDDAERMLSGSIPAWLGLLLKWGAVERIEIAYQHESGSDIKNQIAAIAAIPECPAGVASSSHDAAVFLDHCFTWLGVPGFRSSVPSSVFVLLTTVGEEWYHLLDIYCARLNSFFIKDCGLNAGPNIADQDAVSANDDSPSWLSLIERRVGLPPEADLRLENDFSCISALFDFESDSGKGKIRQRFAVPNTCDIAELLEWRIGHVPFLIQLAEALMAKCNNLIKEIQEKEIKISVRSLDTPKDDIHSGTLAYDVQSPSSATRRDRSRSFLDFQNLSKLIGGTTNPVEDSDQSKTGYAQPSKSPHTDISKSLDVMSLLTKSLFQVQLGAFKRHLDLAIETMGMLSGKIGHFQKSHGFHGLNIVEGDDELYKSLLHLLSLTVYGGSPDQRSLALAAALYILDPDDVIPGDDGPKGLSDDKFCAASILMRLEDDGVKIPSEISEWAFDFKTNVDNYLNPEKQRKVISLVENYLTLLGRQNA